MRIGMKRLLILIQMSYYQALDKAGNPIKGTGPKHILTQIIRLKRKDGVNSYIQAYDAFGNTVPCTCSKPEMWLRTLFNHTRVYDQRTNSTKMEMSRVLATEDVYEMPFKEKN
jgi:hypothetical protein